MRPLLICALAALPLSAMADEEHADEGAGTEASHDSHLSELDGLRIVHGWARASDGPQAQIFMEIENTRDGAVMLQGAKADWAEAATLMGAPIAADGEAMPIGEVEVAAGTTFDLTPDTVYFIMDGMTAPLAEGDEVTVEVDFQGVGHVDVNVEVEAADAAQHSHAGHSH